MIIRSTGWLLCLFVAVVTASEPVSVTEWSMMESGQKYEVMGGSTRLIVDSPGVAAMLEHHVMKTSSAQRSVEDPMMRRLLTSLDTPQAPYIFPQLPNTANQLPNMAPKIFKIPEMAPQLTKMAPKPLSSPNTDGAVNLRAAMLKHHAMRTSSRQGSADDPMMRQHLTSLDTPQAPYIFPQLPNMANQLPDVAPQTFKMPEMVPQLPKLAPKPLSSPSTDGAVNLGCRKEHLSAETAVASAVDALKHSCDDLRQAAVIFIKDKLGQVLGTQGWVHAVRTQPEEVVQLSRLLAVQLAETRVAATAMTNSTTSSQPEDDRSQTATATVPPEVVTCPTSPLDENVISLLRTIPEETKGKDLITAAKSGEIQQIRYLLAGGASPEARDTRERTALQWAAWTGSAEAARCLLDAGADVNTEDDEGYRPLHRAAMGGHSGMVRLLTAAGADSNAKEEWGWTPLHLSVREHRPDVALALLQVGADRKVRNLSGFTPLNMARQAENQPLIDVLTQH